MARIRKKTLNELLKERATGTVDKTTTNNAYTTTPMKRTNTRINTNNAISTPKKINPFEQAKNIIQSFGASLGTTKFGQKVNSYKTSLDNEVKSSNIFGRATEKTKKTSELTDYDISKIGKGKQEVKEDKTKNTILTIQQQLEKEQKEKAKKQKDRSSQNYLKENLGKTKDTKKAEIPNDKLLFAKKDKEEDVVKDIVKNVTDPKQLVKTVKYLPEIAKSVGLGATSSGKNSLMYLNTASEQRSGTYKRLNDMQENLSKRSALDKLMQGKITDEEYANAGKSGLEISRNKDQEEISKIIKESPNLLTKKLSELAPSVGQSATGLALSTINPIVSGAYFFTSAGQGYFDSAKERGFSDDNAFKYSVMMSALDSAMETAISTQGLKYADKFLGTKNLAKSEMFSFLKNDTLANALQEGVMEPLDNLITTVVGEKDKVQKDLLNRSIYSALDGALQGLIMGAGETMVLKGAKATTQAIDKISNSDMSIEQKVQELSQAMKKDGATDEEIASYLKQGAQNKIAEIEGNISKGLDTIAEQKQNAVQNQNVEQNQNLVKKQNNISQIDEIINKTNLDSATKEMYKKVAIEKNLNVQELEEIITGFENEKKKTPKIEEKVQKNLNENVESNIEKNTALNQTKMQNKEVLNASEQITNQEENITKNSFKTVIDKNNDINEYKAIINSATNLNEKDKKDFLILAKDMIKSSTTKPNLETFKEKVNQKNKIVKNILETNSNNQKTQVQETSTKSKKENNLKVLQAPSTAKKESKLIRNNKQKERSFYDTLAKSDVITKEDSKNTKKISLIDTYSPKSNVDTLNKAKQKIKALNQAEQDGAYKEIMGLFLSDKRITLEDTVMAQMLISEYSQKNDKEKVEKLETNLALLYTETGQIIQGVKILNKLTPAGIVNVLEKMVNKINLSNDSKHQIEFTEDMKKKIYKASEDDTGLNDAYKEVVKELGESIALTLGDEVRNWRYFAMLSNPRTHVRNIGANISMKIVKDVKNKVAGALEDIFIGNDDAIERTKTLKIANKEIREFAKQDAKIVVKELTNGDKYVTKGAIERAKRKSNMKLVNFLSNLNSNALELEDAIFMENAYKIAMQQYMTANNLTVEDMQKNEKLLKRAREIAESEAQEATFREASALADAVYKLEKKHKYLGVVIGGALPFKKTPINIAKSGIQYSPIGLVNSLSTGIVKIISETNKLQKQLNNGTINKKEYNQLTSQLVTKQIDKFAKGLTGSTMALIGFALAKNGILKAGNDNDEDEFKKGEGEQDYSIRIGDYTYSLDWLSPSAIPLFMGSSIFQALSKDENISITALLNGTAKALEPMTETTMIQGLTSTLSSYSDTSSSKVIDMISNSIISYLGQFIPTVLGQASKIMDDYERDTTSTKTGVEKKMEQLKNQMLVKVPGMSKNLPIKNDIWGEEKKRNDNKLLRAFEVAISPGVLKKVNIDKTEKELLKLSGKSEEKTLPGALSKDITINNTKIRYNSEEYNKAKENYGKISKSLLNKLINSKSYKELNMNERAKTIANIYDYAKEYQKVKYATDNNLDYEATPEYVTIEAIKKAKGNVTDYFIYNTLSKDQEKNNEKIATLLNIDTDNETKKAIYSNKLNKTDEVYNNLSKITDITIDPYLEYKLQNFTADEDTKSSIEGKTISGSKKEKVIDYINKSNLNDIEKVYIYGTQYKLSTNKEKQLISQAIEKTNLKNSEKYEIYKKLKDIETYKDGSYGWK